MTDFTGLSVDGTTQSYVGEAAERGARRTGALGETFSRAGTSISAQTLTTQQAVYTGIYLTQGTVVHTITFSSGSTAAATPTHQVASLNSPSGALLAQSADLTSTAWAANAEQAFTLTAPYTITADGWYSVGLAINAGTVPTINGCSGNAAINLLTPVVAFTDTANSITATFPASPTKSAGFSGLHAYVS